MSSKAALIILDGWGLGNQSKSDAIACASTPYADSLNASVPHSTLLTDGENVGLPTGQMGNSEVGHMNIGAGRVVWQMLARINKSVQDGSLGDNPMLQRCFAGVGEDKALHILGLMSDGGVHAHIDHMIALCKLAQSNGVKRVYVHAFLDGRDTDPQSGKAFVEHFVDQTAHTGAKLSTLVGRYYAMDRDQRWERVKVAYDLMVRGVGERSEPIQGIESSYQNGVTDEFVKPIRCLEGTEGLIQEGDTVLFANFRTDRGRQLTRALSQQDFAEHGMSKLDLQVYTFTTYDETFSISGVLFENQNLHNTLGEVLAQSGKTQIRAAETEKYPHVTFFFSGGQEQPFEGERRIMAASPKVATYDLQPSMSAVELTDLALEALGQEAADFVCLNYANADMVGHTGVYSAIVEAVETVDAQLQRLATALTNMGYAILVMADHGNADVALNEDGTPNTAHSTNPVPCWLINGPQGAELNKGKLADVAPSILELMGLVQPEDMTGVSLIKKNG
ncbi:MAG: 2,3-bisphosphoglycerate-independent phosphoglycerate mutase [Bacteroidetes bacterium]|nr:2,3-bisphosphoglycerate-independent phosphoglycerate mutase [Bacteroidota bacterium]MDA0942814.1 2,3-bisphosphoglycerate-independent phosphoglycerate mutase [Bacteroidota bacterium]MDA1111842.1 2,3-bisphosphoglycerate-independent phosphoglycerate mutase [Bacteroidota bacterium]